MAVTAAMRAADRIGQLAKETEADVQALAAERGVPTAGRTKAEVASAIVAKVWRDRAPVPPRNVPATDDPNAKNPAAYFQQVRANEEAARAAVRW